MKLLRIAIFAFLLLQNLPGFGQASVYFTQAFAVKWEHKGIKYEMLTFSDDIKVSESYYYSTKEPDLLVPVTSRIKSTDKNAKVNIVEFETEARFKYTFYDKKATGYEISIYPKKGKRVIQGEDNLALWEYHLSFDTTSAFIKGNVERTKITEASMSGITDTENDATIYELNTGSDEGDIKMINSFYTKGSTPLLDELLLRYQPQEVYFEKKVNELYTHIKKVADAKWSTLKGKIIEKDDDDELSILTYEAALQIPGYKTIVFEFVMDKKISFLSSVDIYRPAMQENEFLLDELIKKLKPDFKEYSDSKEPEEDKREISFSKPIKGSGAGIKLKLLQDDGLIVTISPEEFN